MWNCTVYSDKFYGKKHVMLLQYMRVLLTAILFIAALAAAAQGKEQDVFTKIENEANTDMAQWNRYMRRNLQLPQKLIDEKGVTNLTVVVSFIVDKYGRVSNVKAEKDPGYGFGDSVVRLVKNYPGTWRPAYQCGSAVKSYKKIPVIICVQGE
jgi:hypothetical protein